MLGNANGTFQARVNFPAGGQSQDLAAGDFNSDGKQDLAVSINNVQIGLSLLTGNGDGTFNAPVNFPNTVALMLLSLSPQMLTTTPDWIS